MSCTSVNFISKPGKKLTKEQEYIFQIILSNIHDVEVPQAPEYVSTICPTLFPIVAPFLTSLKKRLKDRAAAMCPLEVYVVSSLSNQINVYNKNCTSAGSELPYQSPLKTKVQTIKCVGQTKKFLTNLLEIESIWSASPIPIWVVGEVNLLKYKHFTESRFVWPLQ